MSTVVAHASRNGGKASVTEQTDHGIAEGSHDFGSIVTMDGAFVLAHGHIFDVMQTIFNGPMALFELEQTLRNGDGRRQAGHPIADRLTPFAFGLPTAADLKDLLQTRPIRVAFELRGNPNTSHVHTPMALLRRVRLLLR